MLIVSFISLPWWVHSHLTILLHMQSSEDSRFPGRGRTLSTARDPTAPAGETDPNLHARLLEDSSSPDRLSDATVNTMADSRYLISAMYDLSAYYTILSTWPSLLTVCRQVPIANAAVLPQTQVSFLLLDILAKTQTQTLVRASRRFSLIEHRVVLLLQKNKSRNSLPWASIGYVS